eukprot:gene10001-18627_t
MHRTCCAVGCTNRKIGEKKDVPFYKMPKGSTPIEKRQRQDWMTTIRRADWKSWSEEKISNAFICGENFISGKRSENPDDPNWIPTIFQHTSARDIAKVDNKIAKQARYETLKKKRGRFHVSWKVTGRVSSEEASPHSDSSNDGVVPPCNEENQEDDESVLATSTIARLTTKASQLEEELRERNAEVYKLREENEKLKKGRFGFEKLKKSNKDLKFFTGLPTVAVFLWVVSLVRSNLKKCSSVLSEEDHVLIVLMKLKLGLMNEDIAYRIGCTNTMISTNFRTWLPGLSSSLKNLIVWPSKIEIKENLPQSFRVNIETVYVERVLSGYMTPKYKTKIKHIT